MTLEVSNAEAALHMQPAHTLSTGFPAPKRSARWLRSILSPAPAHLVQLLLIQPDSSAQLPRWLSPSGPAPFGTAHLVQPLLIEPTWFNPSWPSLSSLSCKAQPSLSHIAHWPHSQAHSACKLAALSLKLQVRSPGSGPPASQPCAHLAITNTHNAPTGTHA